MRSIANADAECGPISHIEFDPSTEDGRLAHVLDELCDANEAAFRRRGTQALPSRAAIAALVEDAMAVLYPVHFGVSDSPTRSLRGRIACRLDDLRATLEDQARSGFEYHCQHASTAQGCDACAQRAADVADAFIAALPAIRRMVDADVQAAFDGDPALRNLDEALFCYPGIRATLQYRLAHALHCLEVPLIPRIISELAHSETGIDIHPGATIGPSFFIDHGTGVVIGETVVIGERVRLYQGVTLGARSFATDEHGRLIKGAPRHPIVEDDVVIYAGATILGRITIGRGATIGGNVWVTRSVPAGSRVQQVQPRQETFENGSGI
jgi:serine O-acetyltransferase